MLDKESGTGEFAGKAVAMVAKIACETEKMTAYNALFKTIESH